MPGRASVFFSPLSPTRRVIQEDGHKERRKKKEKRANFVGISALFAAIEINNIKQLITTKYWT